MGRPRARPALATDLLQPQIAGLNGRPVVEVAKATLDAGSSFIQSWRDLEPIVKKLTKVVSDFVNDTEIDPMEAAKLLSLTASVVQKVGQAATTVLRASEGQSRLAILMEGGTQRVQPKAMTEKQLVETVLATARKIQAETGSCPVCVKTIETTAVESHAD